MAFQRPGFGNSKFYRSRRLGRMEQAMGALEALDLRRLDQHAACLERYAIERRAIA